MPIRICGHDYFTPDEIPRMFPPKLRPNLETIRRYIRTGKLHATKFGPGYLICDAAITRLLSTMPRERPIRLHQYVAGKPTIKLLPRPRPNFRKALRAERRRHPRTNVDLPAKPGIGRRPLRAPRPKRKERT